MKHQVILADPPWSYSNKRSSRSDGGKRRLGIGVADRYSRGVMSVDELSSLPVGDVAADNAYLFLWSTWPMLPDALSVMGRWGFRYVSLAFVWVKTTKNGHWFYGPGRYVPSNSEPCLLGVRGKPITSNTGWKPSQVVAEPHPRRHGKIIHSRKPESVQERIENWCGPGLELFATQVRSGWTTLGFDVTGHDIREDLHDEILKIV